MINKSNFSQTISRPKIHAKRPARGIVHVDLAILIDRTDSSSRFADAVRLFATSVIDSVASLTKELRVTVATHGDLDEGMDFLIHCDSVDPARACSEINGITFSGGGLPPESHLDAFESIIDATDWGSIATPRYLLVFLTDRSKSHQNNRSGAEIGDQIRQLKIQTLVVGERVCPQLESLVRRAQGVWEEISTSPDPATFELVSRRVSQTIVQTIIDGSTIPIPCSN